MKPIRVLHVINGLNRGGAEQMLLKLVRESQSRGKWENFIVRAIAGGPLEQPCIDAGATIIENSHFSSKSASIGAFFALQKAIKKFKPDVIQGWMYHGNLLATFAGSLSNNKGPILWNVRHSLSDIKHEKPATRQIIRVTKVLSQAPTSIIYNSFKSRTQHEEYGYSGLNAHVISNGFDVEKFVAIGDGRDDLRARLKVNACDSVIGVIARFHPMKNQLGFVAAAKKVIDRYPTCQFVLAGRNLDENNTELVGLRDELGITQNVHFLGECEDVRKILQGLDCLVMCSSYGEGFPNIIGEAMSCEVPVLATDVGDSSNIIASPKMLIASPEPVDIAASILNFLGKSEEQRAKIGKSARERVIENYSIDAIYFEYDRLYRSCLLEKQ